ncbi:hypothetical protein A2210_00425 [Candidatus Woesebacteria bacterium RIFOXYA1_FULL_40_18]|uniref:Amine oxidase n=2 Tax=Candidatus Woeseibacteriota TaxID=1752722 RepID=A0A0G0SD34_9BACT|nr:MAG: Amine oxidase [Candidatus Woesebacteria bacterium GW2011_GWA1_40_45]OGM76995.1 MAG: hypothetical protein A2210_00425 [Candidatus Woesebacteria bacterium RIFOXYA1_FULL_40_18]
MKIGIIGSGFTGLTAGLRLSEKGHEVVIFERGIRPGGLASGFKLNKWKWHLESHYHHLFTNDKCALTLAKEVGAKIVISRPKTSTFIKNTIYQLDSPFSLLAFPHLSFIDRMRTGLTLLYLKITPFWKPLEKITSKTFIKVSSGDSSWNTLWHPLFKGKFGKYSNSIAASWFWARIKKRTLSLGYPEGGFATFAQKIADKIDAKKGKVLFNTQVELVEAGKDTIKIKTHDKKDYFFDKVICTLPFNLFSKITKGLPQTYKKRVNKLAGIGAINLILLSKNRFLKDKTYWLNICDRGFPFISVVEHSNFINKSYYDNQHILYLGNYLPTNHRYFKLNEKELFSIYLPFLKKLNKNFQASWVKAMWLSKAGFAQPIITKNYSRKIPAFETPIKNLYIANIQQVYPWDRGTNYAIEMGENLVKNIFLKRPGRID